MINMTELAHSPALARQARLPYEDLALVAHLSEVERIHLGCVSVEGKTDERGRLGNLMAVLRSTVATFFWALKRKRAATEPGC